MIKTLWCKRSGGGSNLLSENYYKNKGEVIMCIIIVKNSGVKMPTDEILDNCWSNNNDGAGYMYLTSDAKADKKVQIRKGFMKLKHLKKALKREDFDLNDEVIIHFRISTSGVINQACTHPFPLTKKIKQLTALNILTNKGIAHNGVLGKGSKKLSDTMLFIRDIISDPWINSNLYRQSIRLLLADYLGKSNRLAILDKTGVHLLGNGWINDKKTGLWFSNDSYKFDYKWSVFTTNDNYSYWYDDPKNIPVTCPICNKKDRVIIDSLNAYYCDRCDLVYDAEGEISVDYDDDDDNDSFQEYCITDNLNSDSGVNIKQK